MIHRNLLMYRGARYLWWSLGLIAASCILYVTQGDAQPPNGGTWQGYVLGTVGALLIGMAEQFGITYAPTYGIVFTFVIMVLTLAVRPQGILGKAR